MLDYDFLLPDHKYEMTLTAVDGGTPPRTGSTTVQIWMENMDDEDPVSDPERHIVRVKEDAGSGLVIYTVQAYDPDGSNLTFRFSGMLMQ